MHAQDRRRVGRAYACLSQSKMETMSPRRKLIGRGQRTNQLQSAMQATLLTNYILTNLKSSHIRSKLAHDTASLVSQNHRFSHDKCVSDSSMLPIVYITAAYTDAMNA